MISFYCECGKPFRFSLKFRGRPFRCNTCGRPLVVPEESAEQPVPVDSGEIIAPVKPVLQLDLGSFPVSLGNVPAEVVPVHAEKKEVVGKFEIDDNDDDDDDDDEIIISGNLSKAREQENVFHVALDVEEPQQDSISTILSKAAISQQIMEEQKHSETAQSVDAAPKQKSTSKAGLLSGFFKKKPVVPNVIDMTEDDAVVPVPAPKPPEKKQKASKKQLSAPVPEKPKKAGFLSGFFKKKPIAPRLIDIAENDVAAAIPVQKGPEKKQNASKKQLPVPENAEKPEKPKKAGLLSGVFKKKSAIPKEPKEAVPEKPKKNSDPSHGNKIVTKILVFLGPIFIVAFGALWFWERTQVNAERENVVTQKKEVESLRKQLNDLRKDQTPQTASETVTPADVPSDSTQDGPDLDLD